MRKNTIASAVVFSVALPFAASGVSAAENSGWRIYSEAPNGNVYFFDASRVNSKSNFHEVWIRIRYKTSIMGASSYESLLEIDCSERAERTVQSTFFSDRDWEEPAMSTDFKTKPKRSIRKGSATERLSEILCAP